MWEYATIARERRVIQMSDGDFLLAYCDDGTVWEWDWTQEEWCDRGVRPIPQPEPPSSTRLRPAP
jgi:hypothetical protein